MDNQLAQGALELGTRLATEAAAESLARFGRSRVSFKEDKSVVTEADLAIQARILDAIGEAYPDHAVLAEETIENPQAHANVAGARYCWVVDPLDGTRNYASGLPCFTTSIALLDRGFPIVAVVLEHHVNHLYQATAGGGAALNGKRIGVVEPPPGDDLLLGTPSSKDELAVSVVSRWAGTPAFICRNLGSTAYHLALVARGAFNGAFCMRSKIWDMAAGVLLVTEAGGRITDADGSDGLPFDLSVDANADLPFLAAGPNVHKRLLESIRATRQ